MRNDKEKSSSAGHHQSKINCTPSSIHTENLEILTISWDQPQNFNLFPQNEQLSITELRKEVLSGRILKRILRYRCVTLLTHRIETARQPLKVCLVSRPLSRNKCFIKDQAGTLQRVSAGFLLHQFGMFLADMFARTNRMRRCLQEIDTLAQAISLHTWTDPELILKAQPLYLRTDHVFGLYSGGAVGHTAGVLNNLAQHTSRPVFVATDPLPTIHPSIETHQIPLKSRFRDFVELPEIFDNPNCVEAAVTALKGRHPAFVYQRYSRFNYAGLILAQRYGVPFVLEFNGSEVWIAQNWGRPIKHRKLVETIETLVLNAAHLVVVVSQPIKDELVQRGIQHEKILVNPNGVDTSRYHPQIDGSTIRHRYCINDQIVIGFIGTFGIWHGAEVLVKAFGQLLQRQPRLRDKIHLLLIGDGQCMGIVKNTIDQYDGLKESCTLTGAIPQAQGPLHLAACDILASPHVPNTDGTPFFGSPTKLFEYMAMGKAIIASDLDQIGQVLRHDQTAYLVQPGNPLELANGIEILVDNGQLRRRLGHAARQCAISKHTWALHTRKIIDALALRCGKGCGKGCGKDPTIKLQQEKTPPSPPIKIPAHSILAPPPKPQTDSTNLHLGRTQ